MKSEDVHIKERRDGGLRLTIPDPETDTLVIVDIYHLAPQIVVSTMVRGNYSSGRYPNIPCRPSVRGNLLYGAWVITKEELDRRRAIAIKYEQGLGHIWLGPVPPPESIE